MNATENNVLALSLRVDLANAAIAYANRCVEYSLNPTGEGTFDEMMDAEEMMFDLITEARDEIRYVNEQEAEGIDMEFFA
jgi:hypothetical protein